MSYYMTAKLNDEKAPTYLLLTLHYGDREVSVKCAAEIIEINSQENLDYCKKFLNFMNRLTEIQFDI